MSLLFCQISSRPFELRGVPSWPQCTLQGCVVGWGQSGQEGLLCGPQHWPLQDFNPRPLDGWHRLQGGGGEAWGHFSQGSTAVTFGQNNKISMSMKAAEAYLLPSTDTVPLQGRRGIRPRLLIPTLIENLLSFHPDSME